MSGIDSFIVKKAISIGGGGIHTYARIKKDTGYEYIELGSMMNVATGSQYSTGNDYKNGSHLPQGKTVVGVGLKNFQFMFSKLGVDIASELKSIQEKTTSSIFDDEEEIEYGPGYSEMIKKIDEQDLAKSLAEFTGGKIPSFTLTNLAKPLDVIMFTTADHAAELGYEVRGLSDPSEFQDLAIDSDLEYNVIVVKEITGCVFNAVKNAIVAKSGSSSTITTGIFKKESPWKKLIVGGETAKLNNSDLTLANVIGGAE